MKNKRLLKSTLIAMTIATGIITPIAIVILNGYPNDQIKAVIGALCLIAGCYLAFKGISEEVAK